MSTYTIESVGPIEKLKIFAPPGKVTVLKGPNGSGKSTALAAVTALATGAKNPAVTKKDGAKNGSIVGAGITVKITPSGQFKRTGELELTPVDEELTIADIVDPGIAKADSADQKRVAAICTLLNIEPDLSLFDSCFVGSKLTAKGVATAKTKQAETVVVMANGLKRDVFALALEKEKEAEGVRQEVAILEKSIEGIDLNGESDADVLERLVEEATTRKSTLDERKRAADANQQRLDEIPVLPLVATLEANLASLDDQIAAAQDRLEKSQAEVKELDLKLAAAKATEKQAQEALQLLNAQRAPVAQNIDSSKIRQQLQETIRNAPTVAELEQAKTDLEAAKKKRDDGVIIRRAADSQTKIDEKKIELETLTADAEALRTLGGKFQKRLAELLDGTGLSVNKDDRLVVKHPVRGECLFAELSDGERWTKAIAIAVESARRSEVENGLLQIPQIAWEGLDETNRNVIRDAIAGTDLAIIAAEADGCQGDPIKCEVLA